MLGALPAILTTCAARGLQVGPLHEHGIPGRAVANGTRSTPCTPVNAR